MFLKTYFSGVFGIMITFHKALNECNTNFFVLNIVKNSVCSLIPIKNGCEMALPSQILTSWKISF